MNSQALLSVRQGLKHGQELEGQAREDGRYSRRDADENGIFHSHVIRDLWPKSIGFGRTPLPTLMSVLKEMGTR